MYSGARSSSYAEMWIDDVSDCGESNAGSLSEWYNADEAPGHSSIEVRGRALHARQRESFDSASEMVGDAASVVDPSLGMTDV